MMFIQRQIFSFSLKGILTCKLYEFLSLYSIKFLSKKLLVDDGNKAFSLKIKNNRESIEKIFHFFELKISHQIEFFTFTVQRN